MRLLLLPNIRNSCLNFPLSRVSIVLRWGGNWPLRACGDSCLLRSLSCERQQSYRFYKRPRSSFVRGSPFEVKNGERPVILCCCNKTLPYCCRYSINKLQPLSARDDYSTRENYTLHTDGHTHMQRVLGDVLKSIRCSHAIFRCGRKPVIPHQMHTDTKIFIPVYN